MVSLAISKEIARLEDSGLKIAGTLTLGNIVFTEKNKQILAVINHKGFLGIVATVVRANIGQRIASPRGTHEVISYSQEMNRGPVSSRSHSKQYKLSLSARKYQAGKKTKTKYFSSYICYRRECTFRSGHKYGFPYPHKLNVTPTGIYGSLPSGTVGIILRNSRLNSQGLTVHPGVVDGDREEEIRIVACVRKEMQTDTRNRTAQLLFPYIKGKTVPVERTGAFGSTENVCSGNSG